MGDSFFHDGVESIHDPDKPTTMAEVAADLEKELRRTREGTRVTKRNARLRIYNTRLAEEHTLGPAEDHAHHLVITSEHNSTQAGKRLLHFEAYCKVCGGLDSWTTEEVIPNMKAVNSLG